jgi:hypothetical protein
MQEGVLRDPVGEPPRQGGPAGRRPHRDPARRVPDPREGGHGLRRWHRRLRGAHLYRPRRRLRLPGHRDGAHVHAPAAAVGPAGHVPRGPVPDRRRPVGADRRRRADRRGAGGGDRDELHLPGQEERHPRPRQRPAAEGDGAEGVGQGAGVAPVQGRHGPARPDRGRRRRRAGRQGVHDVGGGGGERPDRVHGPAAGLGVAARDVPGGARERGGLAGGGRAPARRRAPERVRRRRHHRRAGGEAGPPRAAARHGGVAQPQAAGEGRRGEGREAAPVQALRQVRHHRHAGPPRRAVGAALHDAHRKPPRRRQAAGLLHHQDAQDDEAQEQAVQRHSHAARPVICDVSPLP